MTTPVSTDSATGLPTLHGWQMQLPGGVLPQPGTLTGMHLVGVGGLSEKRGKSAGETLLREAMQRTRQLLPRHAVLVRGDTNLLYIWLPEMPEAVAEEFTEHLRRAVCGAPMSVGDGEAVTPRVALAAITFPARTQLEVAVQAIERELVRQPEFTAPPRELARAVSVRNELAQRLSALALFGRDGLIEQILTCLQLPAPIPHTVLLVGPPQAGKTRLLGSMARLLGSQRLPLAEVRCRPSDRAVPCSLLAAIIYQFLTAYPLDVLTQRLGGLLQAQPWLNKLFPILGTDATVALPGDIAVQRQTFDAMLSELVRVIPHIAVIHDLQLADDDSRDVLATLQARYGHGLRIIGGVAPIAGELPGNLHPLRAANATMFELSPLDQSQVQRYLREIVPGVEATTAVDALFTASNGLPLAMEQTLRGWVENGALDYVDGCWEFHEERINAQGDAPIDDAARLRLCQAALAGPQPLSFLTSLWKTDTEGARRTIEYGRMLGYLKSIDFNHPEVVEFVDADQAQIVLQQLTPAERTAYHAEIATLLEASNAGNTDPLAHDLAYHFAQAGQTEYARQYLQQIQLSAAALTPILVTPQASLMGGIEEWDIPPASAIEPDTLAKIIEVALTLRLAVVQFHLYPATSEMTSNAVREAMAALQTLFSGRPSFIITFDGHTVAFDGQIIQRRDLQVAVRDFVTWMTECNLRAIGIARGVREYELARFLEALATFSPKDLNVSLLTRITVLNLMNIRVLTRSFQPDLPQTNMPGGGGLYPPGGAEGGDAPGTRAGNLPPVVSTVPAQDERAHDEQTGDMVPTLVDPEALDADTWRGLPAMMTTTSPRVRRIMLGNLARWLGEQQTGSTAVNMLRDVDHLLIDRLRGEDDWHALHETTTAIEHRIGVLMEERNWAEIIALLAPFRERLQQDGSLEVQRQLNTMLDRVGETLALRGLINQIIEQPEDQESARRLVALLGERALRPLINELKSNTIMQERNRLMQLLCEFGDVQQPLLVQELRVQNPWYVYRNLLQVLAEVGSDDVLGAISEKIGHPDPRVRAEAVATATRLAKETATPYLSKGLEDANVQVRARATSLISLCPQTRILDIILPRLQTRAGTDEEEGMQLTATLGLGAFMQKEAREALLQIVHPRLLSPYRKKSEAIRAAAVTALAQHLPDAQAEAAIKQATTDRSGQVRQAAQRAWQQYQAQR